jgi:hypothetical protein
MPERNFPYGNRGYPSERNISGSGGVGFDRLNSTPTSVAVNPSRRRYIRTLKLSGGGGIRPPELDTHLGRGQSLATTIHTHVETERRGWDSTA